MKRSILSLVYLIKGMRQAGINVDARLAGIGISVDALDPSAILHPSIEWNIQNIIAQRVAPELGLQVGQHYTLAGYGPLLMLLLSCERVEESLRQVVRFQELTHLYGSLWLEASSSHMQLNYQAMDQFTEIGRFRAQCEISATFKFIQDIYKMMHLAVPVIQVSLPFARPEHMLLLEQYQAYYGQDVQFDAPSAQFSIDHRALSLEIPSADAITCRLYERKCIAEIARLSSQAQPDSLVERIRDFLDLQIGILPSMVQTAQALNLPERTLRHQLRQLQTSYKQIREQLIQRKALVLIRDGSYPMAEIAVRLGYSETAAFNHAFRRWFGASPSQYRE